MRPRTPRKSSAAVRYLGYQFTTSNCSSSETTFCCIRDHFFSLRDIHRCQPRRLIAFTPTTLILIAPIFKRSHHHGSCTGPARRWIGSEGLQEGVRGCTIARIRYGCITLCDEVQWLMTLRICWNCGARYLPPREVIDWYCLATKLKRN